MAEEIQEKAAIFYTAGATQKIMGEESNLTEFLAINTVSTGFHLDIPVGVTSYCLIIFMKIVNLPYWSLPLPWKMEIIY